MHDIVAMRGGIHHTKPPVTTNSSRVITCHTVLYITHMVCPTRMLHPMGRTGAQIMRDPQTRMYYIFNNHSINFINFVNVIK